ncbi:MAG: FAD:protein FMN transferase [Pedobacter sp.]|nr:MAG: FAD:protein FMN transferase [Pedobacter sp.]
MLHKRILPLMGNRFEISVVGDDATWAEACIDDAIAEIRRIESLLTTFSDESQTNRINRMAGIEPVQVDQEVLDLIDRSLNISELTQGAFDISYGSIDKRFWNFDTSMTQLPDRQEARNMVRLINYKNVCLDRAENTVFLKRKGMRIGFGGIGKGYAADRAKYILQQRGVEHGIVNAAGDLITWGMSGSGDPWTVGIANPDHKYVPFSSLNISNRAIATSGSYEKYVTIGGKRYAHTIDPKTGFPVSGIKSASVIAPYAELADAMATPLMVMGVEAGLYLINQLNYMACVLVDDNNRIYTSANIRLNKTRPFC